MTNKLQTRLKRQLTPSRETGRVREVVDLLTAGFTQSEVAAELGISRQRVHQIKKGIDGIDGG